MKASTYLLLKSPVSFERISSKIKIFKHLIFIVVNKISVLLYTI